MKHTLIILYALLLTAIAAGAQVEFTGTRVIDVTPDKRTGLDGVYVLENGSAATIHYASQTAQWERFSALGGGYAEALEVGKEGLAVGGEDMGYIITDGARTTRFWVVCYDKAPYNVTGLELAGSDCDRATLNVYGSAPELHFYSINGQRNTLSREIRLEWHTLSLDPESMVYNPVEASESLASAEGHIAAPAPLCDTQFTIYPDRFAREWGIGQAVSSPTAVAVAVGASTEAVQTPRESSNEQTVESESLGGSAPCEIAFRAAVTDAAVYHRWEVSSSPEFDDAQLTYDQLEFTHTFEDAGNTYIRLVANNAEGTCEYIGDTYTVSIGESRLDCPNAFSPGTSEGVNDEWKVSYRSIVSFHCEIFNRWGKKLATLTDPSQGWDGRVGGKTVPAGVYFYVIKARGADGRDYNLAGDINIVGYHRGSLAPEASAE